MKADIIVGIDPDTQMSGVARLDMNPRKVWADHLPFPLLVKYVRTIADKAKENGKNLVVVIECSWRETHNWHLLAKDSKAVAAKNGYDVGSMHATGKKIIEMLEYYDIEVKEQLPLKKCWRGRDRKITHEEMTYICKWDKKRSNPEERDAMLLAWTYAGLPIKLLKL